MQFIQAYLVATILCVGLVITQAESHVFVN